MGLTHLLFLLVVICQCQVYSRSLVKGLIGSFVFFSFRLTFLFSAGAGRRAGEGGLVPGALAPQA